MAILISGKKAQVFSPNGLGRILADVNDEVADFLRRVKAGGDSLSHVEILAMNNLVSSMKSAGIWDNTVVFYPFVGGTASSCSHNLKSSSYQATWYGTMIAGSKGAKSDGSSYGRIALTRDDLGTSFSLSCWQPEASADAFDMVICSNNTVVTSPRELGPFDTTTSLYARFSQDTDYLYTRSGGGTGLGTSTCNGTTAKLFRNSTQYGGDLTITNSLTADGTTDFGIFCKWNTVNASLFYDRYISFIAIFNTNIDASISDWYTAASNFNTALGR